MLLVVSWMCNQVVESLRKKMPERALSMIQAEMCSTKPIETKI